VRWLTRRRIVAAVLIVIVVALGIGVIWFVTPQPVLPEAYAALVSDDTVAVDQSDGRITFAPTAGATTGFIFYPGAKVPPAAYAPPLRAIAERGYLVVIPQMPFNFAVLDVDAAKGIVSDHPEIGSWVLGGHSLGGAMAGQYIASHPGQMNGLALWAAYTASNISGESIPAAVIFGTLDSGAPRFNSPESLAFLPPDPVITAIEGGNHANFAWYTGQPNDPPATIPREEQQRLAVEATLSVLDRASIGMKSTQRR